MADLVPSGLELTPELAGKLLEGAKSGMFRGSVAEAVGIEPDRLDMWLTMGFSPGSIEPYRSFARFYRAAEKGSQLAYIAAWQSAAAVDWRAAQAWLAARHPEEWGAKATQNSQSSALQPTAADAEAEEAMVEALIASRPPVLVRLLEKAGVVWPDKPKS